VIWLLVRRNLQRALTRSVLLVAGVSIAGALLFDMSMLAGGLESSLAEILGQLGYELRVVLRGTLPFATDALLPRATHVAKTIAAQPQVAWAVPLLGTNLYVETAGMRLAAFAVGISPEVRGIVRIHTGELRSPGVIINAALARSLRVGPGDPIRIVPRISPQTGAGPGTVRRIQAIGDFVFDLSSQRTLALPLADLQTIVGLHGGEASFIVVKLTPGADPDDVARRIGAAFPDLEAFSIATLLRRAQAQLTYFNQFAIILSAVSLLVAVLLIGAVLTLAIGERLGELATLRAVGLRRARLVVLVLLEGAVLAGTSVPFALLIGAATRGPLDAILRAAPGVPANLRFFVLSPYAVIRTVLLLVGTATVGAAYPAWIAGRLNISATLHREVQ